MKLSEHFDTSYLKKTLVYALTILFGAAVIIYIGYHLVDRFSSGMELTDAVLTTHTRTVHADAVILREETPLYAYASGTGSVAPSVRDGTRVRAGGTVAEVYEVASPAAEARLTELRELIDLIEKSRAAGRSVLAASNAGDEVYSRAFEIASRAASGEYGEAVSLRAGLLLDIKRRGIMTGEITDYDAQIASLRSEESSLKASLGACLETVTSPVSGYYFSEYDGYGEAFSSERIDDMTYEDFAALTDAKPSFGAGTSVGTVVETYRWYIAVEMSKTDAAPITGKRTVTVTFPYSGIDLEMRLERVVGQTPGERVVLVLSCEKLPEEFDYARMQPVDIAAADYTGFEIPAEAVRVVNVGGTEYTGVYVLDKVTVVFRRISVVYEDDGLFLCIGNDEDNERVRETVQEARDLRAEVILEEKRTKAIRNGTILTDATEKTLQREAASEAAAEISADSLGLAYWLERNDIVIVSGRNLAAGKVVKASS